MGRRALIETNDSDVFNDYTKSSCWSKFKRNLFEVFIEVMKEDFSNYLLEFIVAIIKLAQLLMFTFGASVKVYWIYEGFFNGMNAALDPFRFSVYLKRSSWSVYLFGLYAAITINLISIICLAI